MNVPQELELIILLQILHTPSIGLQHVLRRFEFEVIVIYQAQNIRSVVEHGIETDEIFGPVLLLLVADYRHGVTYNS